MFALCIIKLVQSHIILLTGVSGATGGRSSGSESSSSYIRKRDLPSQYSDISARPPRYNQQPRAAMASDQTPRGTPCISSSSIFLGRSVHLLWGNKALYAANGKLSCTVRIPRTLQSSKTINQPDITS